MECPLEVPADAPNFTCELALGSTVLPDAYVNVSQYSISVTPTYLSTDSIMQPNSIVLTVEHQSLDTRSATRRVLVSLLRGNSDLV